jgi:hypothetical protein
MEVGKGQQAQARRKRGGWNVQECAEPGHDARIIDAERTPDDVQN